VSAAIQRRAGIIDIDALQRRCKAVRVALTTHFAVGNDVEARAFLVSDREERRIVLSLLQPQQAQNDFYKDEVELAMDYATAVNEEI
jgi:hypothetical protein